MATTEKGIYYPDDYTKTADVLADMKTMAESVDAAIEKSKYNDKDIKDEVKSIQDEQKKQDDSIKKNTIKNTEQDELIQKLKKALINETTEQDTSIYIEDASDLPAKLSIEGNHYQGQQEGTSNLVVLNEGSITQDGITISVQDGVGTMSGANASDAVTYITIGTAYLYEGQTYYMNVEKIQTSGACGFSLKNETTIPWFETNTEKAWQCPKTGEYEVRISFGVSTVANLGTFKLWVSRTSGAEWVQGKKAIPSVEYPAEIETVKDNIKIIQCNKNMFNVPSKNVGGVDLTLQEDGKYKINGNSTASWRFRKGEEILLEAGDYTLSVEVESGTLNGVFGLISGSLKYETRGEIHISLTEDKKMTPYFTCSATATFDNVIAKVQLEKDTKTAWVKHEQKEYILPVQQEMLEGDYFDLLNNKEVHNWKKVILNGTENWSKSGSTTDEIFVATLNIENAIDGYGYCNYFKYWGGIKISYFSVYNNGVNIRFCMDGAEIKTIEEFKAWLQQKNTEGNPVCVYYRLATPTKLDLTEEQKEVLQQLNNLDLFKGENNIYTEQDLALLKLDYTVDTKMYINNKISSQNQQILEIAGGN